MKRTFVIIGINFMVLCTLIVGVEILCQLTYLIENGNLLPLKTASVHSRTFERLPYLLFDKPDPFVDKIYIRNLNTLKLLSEKH